VAVVTVNVRVVPEAVAGKVVVPQPDEYVGVARVPNVKPGNSNVMTSFTAIAIGVVNLKAIELSVDGVGVVIVHSVPVRAANATSEPERGDT